MRLSVARRSRLLVPQADRIAALPRDERQTARDRRSAGSAEVEADVEALVEAARCTPTGVAAVGLSAPRRRSSTQTGCPSNRRRCPSRSDQPPRAQRALAGARRARASSVACLVRREGRRSWSTGVISTHLRGCACRAGRGRRAPRAAATPCSGRLTSPELMLRIERSALRPSRRRAARIAVGAERASRGPRYSVLQRPDPLVTVRLKDDAARRRYLDLQSDDSGDRRAGR